MKKIKNIFITILVVTSVLACSKEDDDSNGNVITKDTIQDTLLEHNFKLSADYPYKYGHAYNITLNKTYGDELAHDSTIVFDFGIIKFDFTDVSRYEIASPSCLWLRKYFSHADTTTTTTFYELPENFNYKMLDTIKTSVGMRNILKNCDCVHNDDLRTDYVDSDKFGWGSNQIFGLKTSNGKYGILKIKSISNNGDFDLYIKIEG